MMLSDEQIEQILYKYTNRQDEFSLHIIRIIAKRLSRLADFDKLDVLHKEEVIREDITLINHAYTDYIKKQRQALKDDFWWIAVVIYMESLRFYEKQVQLEKNAALMKKINDLTNKAQNELGKLLKSPVFVIRDLKNPAILKPYNLDKDDITESEKQNLDNLLKKNDINQNNSEIKLNKSNQNNEKEQAGNNLEKNELNRINFELGNTIVSLIERDVNDLYMRKLIEQIKIDQIDAITYSFSGEKTQKKITFKVENNNLICSTGETFTVWLIKNFSL